MEFTLYYRGHLKAATTKNRRRREKHALRKRFHEQLNELWNQTPLKDHRDFLEPTSHAIQRFLAPYEEGFGYEYDNITLPRKIEAFHFVPTVSAHLHMAADLTITLLRPEPPGQIVTHSGDIDNRLKTLLDALKVPSQPDDLPPKSSPSEAETPFFCLVEDDNLIANLDMKSDRLLDPSADPAEIVLLIHVRTRLLKGTLANLGLV